MIGSTKKTQALHRIDNPVKRLALAKALWKWEPHETQRPWFCDQSDIKNAACGRRWGKTESAIVDDVTFAIAHPGSNQMVVAPSRDQVMLLYRPAKELLEETPALAESIKVRETPHPEIVIGGGATKSIIRYRTAGDDGKFLRGYCSHRVRLDEAAYIRERIIKDVIQPQLADFNGQLICQGTPFGKNWFYDYFEKGKEKKYRRFTSFTFPTTSNPYLSKEYLDSVRDELGADSLCYRAEYLAQFVDSMGSVFPWEEIAACLYDHTTAPTSFPQYLCGVDPALYTDFTVVEVGGVDRGMLYIVDWDRFNRIDWPSQKSRIYDTVTKYNALVAMDATHGSVGDPIAQDLMNGEWAEDDAGHVRKRDGLHIDQFDFRNTNKMELIKKVQVKLSHKMIKIPMAFDMLIQEMKYFGFENTEAGNVKFGAMAGHHDDCVCALALLVKLLYGNHEAQVAQQVLLPNSLGKLLEELDRLDEKSEEMVIRPTIMLASKYGTLPRRINR